MSGWIDMKDYTGMRFGRLTVIGRSEQNPQKLICRCDCGKTTEVFRSNLTRGHTQSCGCLKAEIVSAGAHTIHGKRNTRLYKICKGMRRRCRNPHGNRASSYSSKGIKVCEAWEDFTTFEAWALSNGYADNLSIDRIDNDGDYCPENCRWTTGKRQANNRSSNHYLEFNGERKTIADWADATGISQSVIIARLRIGWSVERALTQEKRAW